MAEQRLLNQPKTISERIYGAWQGAGNLVSKLKPWGRPQSTDDGNNKGGKLGKVLKYGGIAAVAGAGAYTAYALWRNGQTNGEIANVQNQLDIAEGSYHAIQGQVQEITDKVNEAFKEKDAAQVLYDAAKDGCDKVVDLMEKSKHIVVKAKDTIWGAENSIWDIVKRTYESFYCNSPTDAQTNGFVPETSIFSERLTPAQIAEHFPKFSWPDGEFTKPIMECVDGVVKNVNCHSIFPGDVIDASNVGESALAHAMDAVRDTEDGLTCATQAYDTILQKSVEVGAQLKEQGKEVVGFMSKIDGLKDKLFNYDLKAGLAAVVGSISYLIGNPLGKKGANGEQPTPTPQDGEGDGTGEGSQGTPSPAPADTGSGTGTGSKARLYSGLPEGVANTQNTQRKRQYIAAKKTGANTPVEETGTQPIDLRLIIGTGSTESSGLEQTALKVRKRKGNRIYVEPVQTEQQPNYYESLRAGSTVSDMYNAYRKRPDAKVAGRLQDVYNTVFNNKGEAIMTAKQAAEKLGVSTSIIYSDAKRLREITGDDSLRFSNKGLESYLATPAISTQAFKQAVNFM